MTVFDKYTDEKTLSKIVDYDSVSHMWQSVVKEYATNVAVVDKKEYTFSEIEDEVARFRALLSEKGAKKGDRVGIFAPNGIEFVKSYLAVTTLGMVAVLLPPHLDEMTVFGCSLKFSLSFLIYDETTSERIGILQSKNPKVTCIIDTETSENKKDLVLMDKSSPSTVLFTGGTTGKSKGALLSNGAIMRGTKNGCYGFKTVFEEKYFLVLPLTHVFGLVRNLLTSLYTGSSIYICKNNKEMFREIAVFKPTMMVMVPALCEMALNLSKQFGKNMLGSDLKYVIAGASQVSPYLITEYKKLGITLLPGYGLTESANLVSGNPEAEYKPSSVGFIYPGMDCKIVDGELWLKGVNMMDGYVGDEEENKIAYSEDGYFKTGDLVRIDEENFMYIVGRKKEVIVLPSGENISPQELESKFYALDAVSDCMVYENNGLLAVQILPRASVLKTNGIENVEEYFKKELQKINESLPSFARINRLVIRQTDFVRSKSMKIVRDQNDEN